MIIERLQFYLGNFLFNLQLAKILDGQILQLNFFFFFQGGQQFFSGWSTTHVNLIYFRVYFFFQFAPPLQIELHEKEKDKEKKTKKEREQRRAL